VSLTKLAVGRPIGTAVIFSAVLVLGVVAVDQLAVDLLPEVDFPRISIVTRYEGVGPEEIETLITRPVEQTVSTVDHVVDIEAVSAEGLSRVMLQFDWGTDLESAVNDVRSYLDRLANRLPDDADRPVVYKFDLASVPIASLGVSGTSDPRRLRYLADETLTRRLERVTGVAAVQVRGGRVREIRVELDAARLVALDVSAAEVVSALAADNRNVSAGDMRETGKQVLIRAVGEWPTPAAIGDVRVAERDGRAIFVRDIGEVVDGFQEVKSEQWIDGDPGITMRVTKRPGANTITVVEGVRAEIERINDEYDGRVKVVLLNNAGDYIQRSVTNVQSAALIGAILAVLVLLFFLRDLRATFLIAVAIPLSIVATFALMFFAGYTLNVISFGGLALGIGMLVDNAIVILENIYRKREEGLPAVQAALEGTREVGPAVIAGTLTTIAVFAPVMFLGGFAGVFFGEMAAVVAFSLGCSLVVALTLVPTLAARLLAGKRRPLTPLTSRVSARIERGITRTEGLYGRFLRAALRSPWFVVASAVLLMAVAVRLSSSVGLELMPETDEGRINVDVELPIGTPVERTAEVVKELERRTRTVVRPEELASVESSAGPEAWWRPGGQNEGQVEVNLVQMERRERGIHKIMDAIREVVAGIPDANIRLRAGSSNILMRIMRGSSGERLEVAIRGHDLATAARLGEEVAAVMRETPGVADVRVAREEGMEERTVSIDTARAADLGVSGAEIAAAVETYVLGKIATRYRERGDEFDVRVALRQADRRATEQLATLPLVTPRGSVPLGAVAKVGARRGPTSIAREGQERILYVVGGLGERPLSAVVTDLSERLARIEKPVGFSVGVAGELEQQDETFGGLATGVLLAILLVYAVMAVQFESLKDPMVVMAAIPFGFIGVVVTLVVTGTTLNMNSFLGTIVLVGIAVNNAIVLVDYTNLLRREHGMDLVTAVVEGGRRRLRPILMTTFTTVLAMLPIALALGEGSEIQAPLARVVLGGLLASTLVTLIVVPCLYYLVERRRAARETAPANVPGAERV
jgi:HAE1 family hydrophobic/amphiphilic exporter-1